LQKRVNGFGNIDSKTQVCRNLGLGVHINQQDGIAELCKGGSRIHRRSRFSDPSFAI